VKRDCEVTMHGKVGRGVQRKQCLWNSDRGKHRDVRCIVKMGSTFMSRSWSTCRTTDESLMHVNQNIESDGKTARTNSEFGQRELKSASIATSLVVSQHVLHAGRRS
jgi:hypothetical protein